MKLFATKPYSRKRAVALSAACLAVILGSVVIMNLQVRSSSSPTVIANKVIVTPIRHEVIQVQPRPFPEPGAAEPLPGSPGVRVDAPAGGITVIGSDLDYLKAEQLQIPVAGVTCNQLRDSFADSRSEGRQHGAIDIPALQNTPVLAAADGTTARLFNSRLGGTTLYQFDKSGRFVFYYAHLSGYADGVAEGKALHKGEVLGYVGDTGNAGPGNFHLHFAISKLSTPWKCYGGEAIDPFALLGGQSDYGR